jgi:hypothetical protein
MLRKAKCGIQINQQRQEINQIYATIQFFFIKEQQKLIPLSSKTCTEFIGHSGFIRPIRTRIFSYRLANRWKKKQENRGKY